MQGIGHQRQQAYRCDHPKALTVLVAQCFIAHGLYLADLVDGTSVNLRVTDEPKKSAFNKYRKIHAVLPSFLLGF